MREKKRDRNKMWQKFSKNFWKIVLVWNRTRMFRSEHELQFNLLSYSRPWVRWISKKFIHRATHRRAKRSMGHKSWSMLQTRKGNSNSHPHIWNNQQGVSMEERGRVRACDLWVVMSYDLKRGPTLHSRCDHNDVRWQGPQKYEIWKDVILLFL